MATIIERLKAEIEKRMYGHNQKADLATTGDFDNFDYKEENAKYQECKDILSIIDTLEVKGVDLEKEYKDFVEEDPVYNKLVNGIVGKAIAKHFFELGLNARKK